LPIDEKAAERVRRVLARRRTISEKKMMGALCFMTGGTMCCGITGDALMVRVGPENYDKALARPHVRPLKIGKRAASGFILIDPPGYRTTASLLKWVAQGLAVAKALRVHPKKRTRAVK
jgi:TfoX/Sxy family transcriptional regulator of competence genes